MRALSRARGASVLLALVVLASCTGGGEAGAPPRPPRAAVVVEPAPPIGALTSRFIGLHDHDPVGASWPDARFGSFRAWDSGVTWRDIETAPGSFDFTRLDAIVDTAERHGADVLVVLGQTPPFHALDPESESFYGAGASSAPDPKAWTAYVREVAERYVGRDVAYQVWNEANVEGFWRGSVSELARLTALAHRVLSNISPRPLLVAPAMAQRLIGQRAFFADFYAERIKGAPVADFVDVVSLQLYPMAGETPEDSMALLAAARVRLAELDVDKPIWNTEVNYGITGEPEVPLASVTQQQANVARTLLLNVANDVDRMYWYAWDQQGLVDTRLTEADGATVSPAGQAFKVVSDWLVGSVLESCTQDEVGTYTCELRRSDGVRWVYWNAAQPVDVPLPDGVDRIESATGEVFPATTRLTVDAIPVMAEAPDGP